MNCAWKRALGALLLAAAVARADDSSPVSTACESSNNLCASINLPSSSSDDDTFFQINATTSGGWAGLGVGNAMKGALMFVVYESSDGNNITLSPRLGKGEFEPLYESTIQAELLPGSGIADNQFVANIKCSNCRSWSGGSLDTTSSDQSMIWAIGPGSQVKSNEPDATIEQHKSNGFLSLNVQKATGGSSSNPFANANQTSNGGSSGGSSSGSSTGNILIAHGAIMAVTWVILFPFGAAIVRLLSTRISHAVALHRALQIFNFALAIVGMAMGIWYSDRTRSHFKHFHQYLGVILVALLFVQALLGQFHHARYQKIGKRSAITYGHIWLGRLVILLAIINGGLGLAPELANATNGQIAAYSVVSAAVVITYTGFYLLGAGRR